MAGSNSARRRFLVALLAVLLVLFLLRLIGPHISPPAESPVTDVAPPQASPPAATTVDESSAGSPMAADLNAPGSTVQRDLQIVEELLVAYRSSFPRSGNPVGDNAEITAALAGRNPLHLVLLPRSHRAINAAGELCDRWGTPLFFHAESGTRMTIRSAGPDRKRWTPDDIVAEP